MYIYNIVYIYIYICAESNMCTVQKHRALVKPQHQPSPATEAPASPFTKERGSRAVAMFGGVDVLLKLATFACNAAQDHRSTNIYDDLSSTHVHLRVHVHMPIHIHTYIYIYIFV